MTLAGGDCGAEKTCPDCAETIKQAANVCRYCGYRFEQNSQASEHRVTENLPSAEEAFPSSDDVIENINYDISKQSDAAFFKFIFIFLGFVFLFGGITYTFANFSRHSEEINNVKLNAGPDESTAVAVCDMTVKKMLVSENSYDPDFGWTFSAVGGVAMVSRKFESQNAFGAKLTSRYACKWDSKTDTIVSLEVTDPFGETRKLR